MKIHASDKNGWIKRLEVTLQSAIEAQRAEDKKLTELWTQRSKERNQAVLKEAETWSWLKRLYHGSPVLMPEEMPEWLRRQKLLYQTTISTLERIIENLRIEGVDKFVLNDNEFEAVKWQYKPSSKDELESRFKSALSEYHLDYLLNRSRT